MAQWMETNHIGKQQQHHSLTFSIEIFSLYLIISMFVVGCYLAYQKSKTWIELRWLKKLFFKHNKK